MDTRQEVWMAGGLRVDAFSSVRSGTLGFEPRSATQRTPHVALLMAESPERLRVIERVATAARLTVLKSGAQIPNQAPFDVVLLDAESLGLDTSPLLCDPELGFPELVFIVDHLGSPHDLALKSRGFRHVVARDELSDWFPAVIGELSGLAQARRTVLSACNVGAADSMRAARGGEASKAKLHAAETSFRSVYLRSLLAEHGSRRKAAEVAGVPYRSFCEMLRKLGI